MEIVQHWLAIFVVDVYEQGINKLPSKYNKCLNNGRDYIEK